MGDAEEQLAFVDGRDALAYIIVKPGEAGRVVIEAGANGLPKPYAAFILRTVADQWDPPKGDDRDVA